MFSSLVESLHEFRPHVRVPGRLVCNSSLDFLEMSSSSLEVLLSHVCLASRRGTCSHTYGWRLRCLVLHRVQAHHTVVSKMISDSHVFQERKRHINIIFLAGDPSGDRGVSRPGGQGSKFYVLSSEPKEHKSFCPDTRPGGPVTGATGKSFMCKSFMCLFCSLVL